MERKLQKLTIEMWRKELEPYTKDIRLVDMGDPYVWTDCSIIRVHSKGSPDFLFLEAGCGTARTSLILAREGARVVGLDITREACVVARRLFEYNDLGGSFVRGDILHLPFKSDVFDVVFCGGSVEHFEDTARGLSELVRVLAKDGFFIATVPLVSLGTLIYYQFYGNVPDLPIVRSLALLVHRKLLKGRYMIYGYEKSFTQRKIRRMFEDAGLSNVQTGLYETTYTVKLFSNPFLKKIARRLAHLRPFWPAIWVKGEKRTRRH